MGHTIMLLVAALQQGYVFVPNKEPFGFRIAEGACGVIMLLNVSEQSENKIEIAARQTDYLLLENVTALRLKTSDNCMGDVNLDEEF